MEVGLLGFPSRAEETETAEVLSPLLIEASKSRSSAQPCCMVSGRPRSLACAEPGAMSSWPFF